MSNRARGVRAAVLLAAICGCAQPPPEPPPHVLFLVLDNVRADRLSQCGYERPTSPFLEKLCARYAASCSCGGQAPSTWTMPSHASYFTGAEVPEHGAGTGARPENNVRLAAGTFARPLDGELPTLAESFRDRGYETISLSGNPLISPASGLTRGFDVEFHATAFGRLYGVRLIRRLERMLAERDGSKPLFLFLNICDAHRPWFAIPEGKHSWLPKRPYMSFPQDGGQPNETRQRFVTGEMEEGEREDLLAAVNDVYDFAVWRSDKTLASVMRVLREAGLFETPYRLVLTSDHGEHLGEHGLLGHAGPYLFEEITRVPVAIVSNGETPSLPHQLPALAVFDLTLDGELRRRPLRSAAFASETWPRWYGPEIGDDSAAAVWHGTDKFVHHDGEIVRYDLETDPDEREPTPWTGGDEAAELEALIQSLEAVASGQPVDEEMLELLRALGYL